MRISNKESEFIFEKYNIHDVKKLIKPPQSSLTMTHQQFVEPYIIKENKKEMINSKIK